MKNLLMTFTFIGLLCAYGCTKSNENGPGDDCNSGYSCFECTNCQGPYGHLINGEYCVSGFDNCEDWENAKTNYETNDGCQCAFTN